MGKLAFFLVKTFKIFLVIFGIIFEIVFMFTAPIAVMELMDSKNDAYYWLYLISIPLGISAIIVTVATINWYDIFDLDYTP